MSRKLVHANRENEELRKQQEEYQSAIEEFININRTIEELKKNK